MGFDLYQGLLHPKDSMEKSDVSDDTLKVLRGLLTCTTETNNGNNDYYHTHLATVE